MNNTTKDEREDFGKNIGLVILAAGGSRRMGIPKQLLMFQGESLLRHTVQEGVASACDHIVVVLGAHADQMRLQIGDLPVRVILNPHWQRGIGSSIRTGVAEAVAGAGTRTLDGVIVSVCDQPYLTARVFRELIEVFRNGESDIVAATYDETLGVPALFSRHHFNDLLNLEDGEGAKKLLESPANDVVSVPFVDGGFDIDTAQDYTRLRTMPALFRR